MCVSVCLPAFVSVAQLLWDCHKVLITHMTNPTSCLPCILGLSGLKNPSMRLFFPLLCLSPVLFCPPPLLFSPFTVTGFCGSRISLFPKWVADVFLESPIVWWRGSPSLFFTPLRPPSPAEPSYPATRPSRYDLHGSTSQQPVSLESFPFKLAIY